MNILVNCHGFIGDILFSSSLAKKLKEKYPGCIVTYAIPLIQPRLLLQQNPYIDLVTISPIDIYDLTINVPHVDQQYPATAYMQAMAGIEDQSTEFDVYTVPEYDVDAVDQLDNIRTLHEALGHSPTAKLVAFQNNWAEKSFEFTREEYDRAIDVPNLGYGGRHRNINIISEILLADKNIIIVNVGLSNGVTQRDPSAHNADSYAYTASLIKHCDWFMGSEGGLSNLACALGTKCIITTDFIHQLYGSKGVIRQLETPMMGPAIYYPDAGHIHLDPYLTDADVAHEIIKHISA